MHFFLARALYIVCLKCLGFREFHILTLRLIFGCSKGWRVYLEPYNRPLGSLIAVILAIVVRVVFLVLLNSCFLFLILGLTWPFGKKDG